MTEQLSPVQRAFLNSIAAGESPGYDVIYGGQRFQDFTDHPRIAVPIKSGPNVGRTSSAAGRYQFLGSTWDEAKSALGLPDFSPASQDRAAAWLAGRDYKKRTGRDLWSDVEGAAGDPKKLDEIGSSLSGTWTSLPNGIERNRATSGFGQRVATELSAQSRNSSPTAWGAVPVEDSPSAWGAVPVEQKGAPSIVERALSPITTYPETQRQMAQESYDQMAQGAGQVKEAITGEYAPGTLLKGVGNAAMGALGYIGSPVNAALRTVVGQPVEDATGIPKEAVEFGTSMILPMPKRVPNIPARAPVAPVVPGGQEALQAAQRIEATTGVPVNIPRAVASDNIVANQAGRTVANIPIAGAPLRRASEDMVQGLDDAATAVRDAYGTGNMANAGSVAREAIEQYGKAGPFKQKVTDLYNQVDQFVNPVVVGPMPNTAALRNSVNARRANAGLPDSKQIDGLEEALSRPGMNYEGIKDLRTFYGEMKDGNRAIPEGMGQNEVNAIYSALTKDMRLIIAKAGGADGLKAWEKANREAARWAEVRTTLNGILGAKSDEALIDKIMATAGSTSRADVKTLGRARGAVGGERWSEVASAVIERMISPPGAQGFSVDRFVTAYNKMTPQGRDILFRSKNHASHAQAIDDIATIAGRIKSHNQYANPSGTGQTVATFAGGIGAVADPISTTVSLLGGRMTAQILAKPATARAMASYSRAYSRAVINGSPAAIQGYQNASKVFAASVGTELSRSDMVPSLTRQLQQLVPSRAEQEPVNPEGERQ
jgi:muramidase (phage lysozyme)